MAKHAHTVRDTDPRFTINPATRTIKNMTEGKTTLMQYDHNSEEFTFELPRYIDGHDMAQSTVAQVHYENGDSKGRYDADDLQVSVDDENKVTFTWLISQNATLHAGALSFLVKFRCYDGDAIVYEWNTDTFDSIKVKAGKNHDDTVVQQNADAIEKLRVDMTQKVEDEVAETFGKRLKEEVWTFTLSDGTKVNKTVWVP